MDNDLDKWKDLWGAQKSEPLDLEEMIGGLNKIESKSKRERLILAIVFPLTIGILLFALPVDESIYYLICLVCIFIAMIMIFLQMYQSRIQDLGRNTSLSNHEFIQDTIKRLKSKKLTTSFYMWIYTVLLLVGINVGYLEVLKDFESFLRISIHLILSLTMLGFMYFSIRKRVKKNDREIQPIIDELEGINT